MLTMLPLDGRGAWGAKQKKEYILDRDGNKIYGPTKRQYKCKSIPATGWNEQNKSERAFTVSCGRNRGNSNRAGNRIWNGNKRGGGIVNIYYRRSVLDFY